MFSMGRKILGLSCNSTTMENSFSKWVLALLTVVLGVSCSAAVCFAAVGCSLNDPDRDVKRIFPQSTSYRTDFITIQERGGDKLKAEVERRLGDTLDNVYETSDVPYAYYTILKGKEVIGRIHGVNEKGLYGGMQLILATDPGGRIVAFYYQKLSSPEASKFRSHAFTDQFKGLTLEDFYRGGEPGNRLSAIKDPTHKQGGDFIATIRGLKKNLILLDEFMLHNAHEQSYKHSRDNK
jgi:hypothetical protein